MKDKGFMIFYPLSFNFSLLLSSTFNLFALDFEL